MEQNNEIKYKINKDKKELLGYIIELAKNGELDPVGSHKFALQLAQGGDTDPIKDWDGKADKEEENAQKNISDLIKNLQKNKGLLLLVERVNQNPDDKLVFSKDKISNVKEVQLLLDLGIIEPDEMEPDRGNPTLEKPHEETRKPEEATKDEEKKEDKKPEEKDEEEVKSEDEKAEEEKENKEDKKEEIKDKPIEDLMKDETQPISESLKERLLRQVDEMKMPETLKEPMRSAYRQAVYMSQLMNPDYLKDYLENDEEAKKKGVEPASFGKFHKGILVNTYVEYKAEENSKELSEQSNEGMNVTYLEFPQMVNDMPQWLKAQVNEEITYYMKYAIDRILNGSNSYDAMVLLTPIDDALEQGLRYAENSNSSNLNSNIKKAYIKYISADSKNKIREEFKIGSQNVDITLNTNDIDWTNPRIRKDMIRMINRSENEAVKKNIEQLVKNVSFDYIVQSEEDVAELKEICKDFKALDVAKDVSIVVQVTNPAERKMLSEKVDGVIGNDSEISNDTYKADNMINMGMNQAITAGVGIAMGVGMAEAIGPIPRNIAEDPNLNKKEKVDILTDAAMRNERLMNEIAMNGDNPVEYMEALTMEMLEAYEQDEQSRAREEFENNYNNNDQ